MCLVSRSVLCQHRVSFCLPAVILMKYRSSLSLQMAARLWVSPVLFFLELIINEAFSPRDALRLNEAIVEPLSSVGDEDDCLPDALFSSLSFEKLIMMANIGLSVRLKLSWSADLLFSWVSCSPVPPRQSTHPAVQRLTALCTGSIDGSEHGQSLAATTQKWIST